MAYRSKTIGRLGHASKATMQQFTIPASTGGINALDNLMTMSPTDCIYCNNIMPSEYGLRLRKGYRQWASGVPGSINTLIPFEGQEADASADRLWAVCPLGIYDVTSFGDTAPAQVVAFSINTEDAGFGVWTEFTNDNGDRLLFYADSKNGLHQYTETTGLWTVPSFTGGVVVEDVAYVIVWKEHLWMVEEESGVAWYTEAGATQGNVKKFVFGAKFVHGGELKSLYNWTIDGGEGMDDLLVAISRGGDVLVYQGIDPAVDLSSVGSFFLGEVPESRRLAVNYGGELYVLSVYGITSIRDLLQGVVPSDAGTSPSSKISRFLRQAVQDGKDELTWSLHINPSDGFLQITTPFTIDKEAIQYNQNLLTRAWGRWRGVPANSVENWSGDYYMGGIAGNVAIYDGVLDGTTIDGPDIWNDTPLAAGAEWTNPLAGEFACDGTQIAETEQTFETGLPAENGVEYEATYTITGFVAGQHAVGYGSASGRSAYETGDGTFTVFFKANGIGSLARVVGDVNFQGTFSLVSLKTNAQLGSPIDFDILTAFIPPNGDISNFKRVGFIRTIGIVAGTANINVGAVYDYSIEEELLAPPAGPSQGFNIWDTGVWDTDLWDFSQKGVSFPLGSLGLGRTVAVAMRGNSNTRLNIIGWDLTYTSGGFL